jgi:hypothetical protein
MFFGRPESSAVDVPFRLSLPFAEVILRVVPEVLDQSPKRAACPALRSGAGVVPVGGVDDEGAPVAVVAAAAERARVED